MYLTESPGYAYTQSDNYGVFINFIASDSKIVNGLP